MMKEKTAGLGRAAPRGRLLLTHLQGLNNTKVLRKSSSTRVPALFAVVAVLSGALMSHAAMAQEEKAVKDYPAVLQRDITLWSDGTRLSGVLLYPKDRREGERLPALVMCNGWGGTKAFRRRTPSQPSTRS